MGSPIFSVDFQRHQILTEEIYWTKKKKKNNQLPGSCLHEPFLFLVFNFLNIQSLGVNLNVGNNAIWQSLTT